MAPARFDRFVVFAEMRTGSNLLEDRLNQIEGVRCHGELFNPGFVGYPDRPVFAGIDVAARERDPRPLLDALKAGGGLNGFRYFHDHDPRVLPTLLDDPRCAKIVLTRNPIESYVSLKIARQTGQWRLTDAKDRKAARIRFDADEFATMRAAQEAFRAQVRQALQRSGQVAFPVDYTDLGDAEMLGGLAAFLGVSARRGPAAPRLVRQNPEPLRSLVENPAEMEAALAGMALGPAASLERAPAPAIPTLVAAAQAPLLYIPLKGSAVGRVVTWLAALDGVDKSDLIRGFTRQRLHDWRANRPQARAFSVLAHPVDRAHRVFCRFILSTGPDSFVGIRETLRTHYDVPLPEGAPGPDWTYAAHRAAFLGFLRVATANLAGQTGFRTDPAWSSQWAILQGLSEVILPDILLREPDLDADLTHLASGLGIASDPPPAAEPTSDDLILTRICDAEVQRAVRALHPQDYSAFGFADWTGPA